MAVLLLADVVGGALATDQVAKTLTAVKSLGPVTVLVAGPDAAAAAAEAATLAGVAKVLLAEGAGVIVACGEGALCVTELQKPGGKRLPAAEFLRGMPIAAGSRFD